MRVANVPERKWGASLDKVPGNRKYVQDVRAYLGRLKEALVAGDGLLLWGPYRSGKSSLATCVLREVAAHRCRPYWLESFALVDGWLAGEDDLRRQMVERSHLLVVDDLGMEGAAPIRKEILDAALRMRLERGGATVVTTNMSPEQMLGYYGEKLVALLKECLRPVSVEGVDWTEVPR